jgi:regulatory protein YycH of two-component signal transduction system YycFG
MIILKKIWGVIAGKLPAISLFVVISLIIYVLVLTYQLRNAQENYIKLQIKYNERIISELEKAVKEKRDSTTIIHNHITQIREDAKEQEHEIDDIDNRDSLMLKYYELRPNLPEGR